MVKLVGILNITPDSFSDGGRFVDVTSALAHARQMFEDGASLVDVGAESTRPNADVVGPEEEWARLEPILKVLIDEYPGKISLDSHHPETIRRACKIGPVIVNDVTGMNNSAMVDVVVELKSPVIISHLPGLDVQAAHQQEPLTSMSEVKNDLLARAAVLEERGLPKDSIILDPGIGFGKTMDLNRELLTFAEQVPEYQVMIGYSKKRFLGERRMELEPNLEAGNVAADHGAAYLRVHDVKGHQQFIR